MGSSSGRLTAPGAHDGCIESLEKAGAIGSRERLGPAGDLAHPTQVLANIYRALRPGGVFLMVDIKASSQVEDNIGVPFAAYLYTVSTMHCMSVSLGLDGDGLGTVWGRQLATTMLADAGFRDVQVHEIDSDPINFYYVARK